MSQREKRKKGQKKEKKKEVRARASEMSEGEDLGKEMTDNF